MTLLSIALVATFTGIAYAAGQYIDWFVSSPYCMPFLRRVLFTFMAASWMRAAYAVAVRVLQ